LNSRLNFLRCIDALRSMKTPYLGVHQTGSTSVVPSRLQVLNSRRGTAVTITTEDFAQQIAGQSASAYLYGIVRFLSEGGNSQ
ncbi:hypothetical protein, partial [Novosphingobium sediminicola]|uniref:hypothetical protein n=1 Tax=Novosphingobium sediminicola TaxID=563162 RepID=UPI001C8642C3